MRAAKVCSDPHCAQLQPCPTHGRKPWEGAKPARLRGRRHTRRRQHILRSHGSVCHVCGLPGGSQVDHVVPLAEGGADDESNLRPIHPSCHRRKTLAEAARGRNG